MRVNLVGPDEVRMTDHKIDAATAAFLAVQLSKRNTHVFPGAVVVEPPAMEITLDDEVLRVKEARIKFWTAGNDFEGELTLTLEKP